MAKPSTLPVAANWAAPTRLVDAGKTAVVAIQEALGAMALATNAASSRSDVTGSCGNANVRVSGPVPVGSFGSPKKFKRAVDALLLLFTRVKVLTQFSSAVRCAMEPIKFRPAIDAACC